KFDPAKVPGLPDPKPMFEIFVYSTRFEGVHLRGGKVARGGLRWSDRLGDFRTEVLGLLKAQMVKNTVIVPVGSKGGFVLKRAPSPSNRDAYMKEGVACYQNYLRGLLDLTDNRVGDKIVAPPRVKRHDPDDPYLVVAADKGTATFSDYANGISAEYGFWLGDAFASGGSAGYDHKKMGITAKGAWESVKRHFREMGIDTQSQDFTVVGIGDMSGDMTPPELLKAILKSPVDLFYNGGIGTYVKASHQSNAEAGDRANDAIRVNGKDLRCKVVGEGGNLGFTQLGRVEYAQSGGRI